MNSLKICLSSPRVEEKDMFLSLIQLSLLHVNWDKEHILMRQSPILSRARLNGLTDAKLPQRTDANNPQMFLHRLFL